MKILLTALMIVGLIGISNTSFATGTQETAEAYSETSVENQVFKGEIMKTEDGFALLTSDESYLLQGDKLEELVGKTVNINGQLLKTEAGNKIVVAAIELIKKD